jgi:uncharacterized protein
MTKPPNKERLQGFDVARAFAILGMVLVHFALTLSAPGWKESWLAWLLDVLDGRAAATFLVLAGVGIALRVTKAQGDDQALKLVRQSIFRRGLFLLVAGFLLLMIWPGDILRVYGVTMLLASLLLTARSAWLWGIIATFVAGFLLLFALLDYDQNWKWESMTYLRLWSLGGQLRNLFYDGFRSVFPWSAFLFFGMWLGRLNWKDPRTAWLCLSIGGSAALLLELLSKLLVARAAVYMDRETAVALLGTISMPPLPIFLLAASSTAVAVIGGSVLLANAHGASFWLRSLVATGQLAFTWYIGHILVVVGIIVGFGFEGTQQLPAAVLIGAGFFGAAALASYTYKQRFNQGPLEWFIRAVAG